jgi:hypothetical protein
MKRILLFLLLTTPFLRTQAQTFQQGSNYIHLGAGLMNPYSSSGSRSVLPPIHIAFERAVLPNLGLGGIVAFHAARYNGGFDPYTYTWHLHYLTVGARAAYHITEVEQVDLYLGGMAGISFASSRYEADLTIKGIATDDPAKTRPVLGAFVGARRELTQRIILFAELGYSTAWLNAGVCFRMF